ncbi:MAG: NAD(P)/FAD-dependent oxidoreductase [Microbacterium sp.]|uniref:flavin-containing monooxygenase n=1 Tax=Microbacterium sp. TaxID=51671 RepID=UPI002604208B|nr:NAD(P)/FAD-dependent oxidoreductase [Microbacterium sp.]MDF2562296.1 NAD(P)/FAD-dependent oxidoreductase [Microbacterium sp.]
MVNSSTAPADTVAEEALSTAEPALLLASLAMWQGDLGLIERHQNAFHKRDANSIGPRMLGAANGVHDVDPDAAAEIRDAALRAYSDGTVAQSAADVDDAAFGRVASFVFGESVRNEYVPLLREQSGFEKSRPRVGRTRRPESDFEVIIIGSGMSGLTAAVKLAEAGFRYKIFEKSPEAGGTWVTNRYPGAAVDTPSHYYSFSFELNPDWQKYYATGPEYLKYLNHVLDKYDIRQHVQCSTEVVGAVWNEADQRWTVTTDTNGARAVHSARAILSAVGFLNSINKPEFPGTDSFRGRVVHSAEWRDDVALEGKNVVLVGSGCTAVQIASATAPVVERLTIVQRTRQWIVPARTDTPVSESERWLLANIPYYHQWFRARAFWYSGGSGANHGLTRVDPEWAATHVSTSPANDAIMKVSLDYIDAMFEDRPDLKEKLVPDYPIMVKRIIMDPGYYPTLKRSNVELHEGSIARIEPDAVVLTDGTRVPCDVLVLATGFYAEWLSKIDIRGRGGRELSEYWGDNPTAYLGVAIPGFPNFFMTCGPNSAPTAGGHNLTCEEQVHFLIEALQLLVEKDLASIEVTEEAHDEFNRRQDAEVDKMVWGHPSVTAQSYQHNSAGRGLVSNPWTAHEYWEWMREPRIEDFILTPSDSVRAA